MIPGWKTNQWKNQVHLLFFMCALFIALQTQAVAQNAIEKTSGEAIINHLPTVLVASPSKPDRNRALLVLEANGTPAIYPILRKTYPCTKLERHSLNDILAHWALDKVENGIYKFSFVQWQNAHWERVIVELKFRDDYCSEYRVVSKTVKGGQWLDAKSIPSRSGQSSDTGNRKLTLPFFIGVIEGPRDMSDCGIDPMTEKEVRELSNGKCPLGKN